MTYRQAVAKAFRQLGRDEKSIKEAFEYADRKYPKGAVMASVQVPKDQQALLIKVMRDFFENQEAGMLAKVIFLEFMVLEKPHLN